MAFFFLMLLPLLLGGRWSRLLRVLVPSWRFFEQCEPGAQLYYRRDQEEWQPAERPLSKNLFLNESALLELATRDLVHAFTADLEGRDSAAQMTSWTSYRLLANLVRQRLGPGGQGQFKLTESEQDCFLSGGFAL